MPVEIISTPLKATAELIGDIDHHNAFAIREEIDEVINRSSPTALRLDFAGVTFMDSSGIGLVMGRYRLVNSYGGSMEVVNLSERMYKVMQMSGLQKLVRLAKREEMKN